MNLSNEVVITILSFLLVVSYLLKNHYQFTKKNSNIILLVSVACYYLVKRIVIGIM